MAYTRAFEVANVLEKVYIEEGNTNHKGGRTRSERFLYVAKDINNVVNSDSWSDGLCGGGVYWSRDFEYKNAITIFHKICY